MDQKQPESDTELHRGASEFPLSLDAAGDPASRVDQFRQHRANSVREEVLSTVVLSQGVAAYQDDQQKLAAFMAELVDAKAVSREEAEVVDISKMSHMSRLRRIAEHREVILHPHVIESISSGYSVLYELVLLVEALPGSIPATDQLKLLFDEMDGPVSKSWLKAQRARFSPIKTRKKSERAAPARDLPIVDETAVSSASQISADALRLDEVIARSNQSIQRNGMANDVSVAHCEDEFEHDFEDDGDEREEIPEGPDDQGPIAAAILVIDVDNEADLVWAANEKRWNEFAFNIAKDANAFVFAPLQLLLGLLPVIGSFGCPICTSVYPLKDLDEREMGQCIVLAIFKRGAGIALDIEPHILPDEAPLSIAKQFLPNAPGRLVQVLADGLVEGWDETTIRRE